MNPTANRSIATERSLFGMEGDRPPLLKAMIIVGIFACLASCVSDRKPGAAVSGKTVYRGMGIEDVVIQILRSENQRWVSCGTAKSGYHGSFMVRLAAGRYRLNGRTVLPSVSAERSEIRGVTEVTVGKLRVDRVVIVLAEAR